MQKLGQLISYHTISYFKTARIVMPLIVWVVFLASAYYAMPQNVVGSFSMSSVFLYIIMIWVTISYMESVNAIEDQLFLLKVENEQLYYWSKNLFVVGLGLLFTLIGILFPLFINAINGNKLFMRPFVFFDFIAFSVLHILAVILGVSIGTCLQPRCIKDRKLALIVATTIAVLSLVKASIIKGSLWIKVIFAFIPPITDSIAPFTGKEFFTITGLLLAIIYMCVYSAIILTINSYMLKRKSF